MKNLTRALPTATLTGALMAALLVAACGGGATTTPPATSAPGATQPAATTGPGATSAPGGDIDDIGAELLAPIFGTSIPTPTCTDTTAEGRKCRWVAGDGDLLLDAESDRYGSESAWREAFGTAGFDEEIPGIGVAALGGDNPLADGWRGSVLTGDGVAYTVTVNKPGDQAAVKAIVIAILTALAS